MLNGRNLLLLLNYRLLIGCNQNLGGRSFDIILGQLKLVFPFLLSALVAGLSGVNLRQLGGSG